MVVCDEVLLAGDEVCEGGVPLLCVRLSSVICELDVALTVEDAAVVAREDAG
jgi:hypothetical protein